MYIIFFIKFTRPRQYNLTDYIIIFTTYIMLTRFFRWIKYESLYIDIYNLHIYTF